MIDIIDYPRSCMGGLSTFALGLPAIVADKDRAHLCPDRSVKNRPEM